MNLIIGNIISFIASALMVSTGMLKNKLKIVLVQTVQIGLFVISNLILGSIPGAIINGVSCVRNILCYKDKLNKTARILIIAVASVLTIAFNDIGIIGYLPLISTVVYTACMNEKDIIKFKLLVVFTMIMWLIHDAYIQSYTSAAFNMINIIVNAIAINKIRKQRNESHT